MLAFPIAMPGPSSARPVPRRGELGLFVVLAAFPDRALAYGPEHFVGAPDALVDRLADYYAEVSTGRLRIVPRLGRPIVTLPQPRARYVHQAGALARDALSAFVASAEPAEQEALTASHAVVVFFAGTGRESHLGGGDPTDPWSNYTPITPPVAGFDDACIIAESEGPQLSSFGVLCHEFGHQLGLPELYAPGGAKHEGIGVWGLMGQGTWGGRGDRPTQLEAWSKARLGWVEVQTVDRTTRGVEVPAVSDVPLVVKIPAAVGRPEEYYLLENRRRTGVDERLPGEGILVWHVDERVTGFRSAQKDPRHKLLHLVEADGRGDLDRGHAAGGNRGDATDPWVGPPRVRRTVGAGLGLAGAGLLAFAALRMGAPRPLVPVLIRLSMAAAALAAAAYLRRTPVCGPETPGMLPYGGTPGRVVLRGFSPAGPRMTVDVLMAPEPPRE